MCDTIVYPTENRPNQGLSDDPACYLPAWNRLALLLEEYGRWLREQGLSPTTETPQPEVRLSNTTPQQGVFHDNQTKG